MTNTNKQSQWSAEEIATTKKIMETNTNLPIGDRFSMIGRILNRTPNAVQFKWYQHIKNVRASDSVFVASEPIKDNLIKVRTAKVYEALTGEVFLEEALAIHANTNYILEQMESADNLYNWMIDNKDKVQYILNSK
jgi:hypothetical protein